MMKNGLAKCISFVKGNVADKRVLDELHIDAIVNAADPTLMGSTQGVDGAIHRAIGDMPGGGKTFKDLICEELKTDKAKNRIRCQRGDAVLTSGYGLCDYVIHVVGSKYDGKYGRFNICSSSAVQTLESCYYNIVERIKEQPGIKRIAIPIISSGAYGFPFWMAAEIAVTSIYNALVEWQDRDLEMFELSELEQIYFFVYHKDSERMREQEEIGNKVLEKYNSIMKRKKRVVFQLSTRAHLSYWMEIALYDRSRGYFSVAKRIRELLMFIRLFFLPGMWLKDIFGGRDWEKRRQFVEWFTVIKAVFPVFFYFVACKRLSAGALAVANGWLPGLIIYNMCDTVTYLLVLIILTDIQRPSANIIRSMIMLFVNYMEVSMGMSYLYFIYNAVCKNRILPFYMAAAFGVLGKAADDVMASVWDYVFAFADTGIKFFFITLVFSYLADHMRQRKFRS